MIPPEPDWMIGEPPLDEPYELTGWPPASIVDVATARCYKCLASGNHVAGQCIECKEYKKEDVNHG